MKVTGLCLTCLLVATSLPAQAAPEKNFSLSLSMGPAPEFFLTDAPSSKFVDPFGAPYVFHGSVLTKTTPRVRNSYPRLDFPGPGHLLFREQTKKTNPTPFISAP